MNHIKQLAGQTAVYGLGVVIPRLMSYILLTPFYTRVFDKAEYGIITELYAYVVFLIVVLTYGLETGFFRFTGNNSNNKNVYKTVLISLLLSSLLWLFLVFLSYKRIAVILDYENLSRYILWLGIIVGIDAFTAIPFARLRLENRALKYSIIRITEVLVNLFFNWFFIWYCHNNYEEYNWISKIYNPEYRVGYVLVSNLISSIIKLGMLYAEIFRIKGKFDFSLWKNILAYSFPLLIAGLAGTVNEALDRILLKHLIPPPLVPLEELGVYGANFKLAVLMTLFIQMFRYAAEPFFFSKMNDRNAKKIYADIMRYFVFTALLIFLVVVLFIDIFKLFIGKEFRDAIGIVPIILIANIFMGIYYNLSIWFKIENKTRIGALLVIGGAIITLLVNYFFIPSYSYYASAWGHLFAYGVMVVLCYLIGQKYYRIDYGLANLLFYTVLAFIIYFSFKWIRFDKSIMEYSIKIISLMVYVSIFAFRENLFGISRNNNN